MPMADLPSSKPGIAVCITGIKCVVFNDHVHMEFPSCHTPGKVYTVEYSPSIEHCSCASFMYRNNCRHIAKAKELFKYC